MYDGQRYFALTGNRWPGSPQTIEHREAELEHLYEAEFGVPATTDESKVADVSKSLIATAGPLSLSPRLQYLVTMEPFKATWEKRRGFASLSEYDMALANIGLEHGCTDQDVADLIVAFRMRWGSEEDIQKGKRPDYLARTITKARDKGNAEFQCGLTDMGNARRLQIRHGDNLRYSHLEKEWLHWDGQRWQRDDIGHVMELAKETVTSIRQQLETHQDPEARDQLRKRSRSLEGHTRLRAMIELAKSEPGIAVLPKQLDTDPEKMNVLNGTVDLRTGELYPHRPG